ncbi:MAG: sulfatase [Halieaceae bacterium]|nr:sulfatase [Halieaceae bacterium]
MAGLALAGLALARFAVGAWLVVGIWLASSGVVMADQPNILIILSDDHGARDIGAYGNQRIRTPHLDALAAQGMRFDSAFATEAICTPSRTSLYTGLYPLRHGAHRNHTEVYEGVRSMPHYFSSLGYRVALAGKTHFGPMSAFPFEMLPRGEGDTVVKSHQQAMAELFDDPAAFLLVVATSLPHSDSRSGGGYPRPENYQPADVELPGYLLDTWETRQARAGYYELVSRLDDDVGRVMGLLARSNAAGNTLVIYVSDHGSGFPYEKWTNYDAGIRVPLLVRWPGKVEEKSSSNALISLVDILPTLLEAAGGDAPADLDGRSFLGVLEGESEAHLPYIFATHTTLGIRNSGDAFAQRTIRSDRFKYILNLNPQGRFTNNVTEQGQGGWYSWLELAKTDNRAGERVALYQKRPAEEFYDLEKDPHELLNLAASKGHQALAAKHRVKLEQWRKQQGDQGLAHPYTGQNLFELWWHEMRQRWNLLWSRV